MFKVYLSDLNTIAYNIGLSEGLARHFYNQGDSAKYHELTTKEMMFRRELELVKRDIIDYLGFEKIDDLIQDARARGVLFASEKVVPSSKAAQ
jgi:hypothetical protein